MNQPSLIIENDTDLHYRIMKLNNLKEEQELAIRRNVRELMYSVHPAVMVKNLLNKITGDRETRQDLRSVALSLGKDFLISRVFGGKGSLKGFLSSLLVKKATDYVMNNHSEQISKGILKVEDLVKTGITKVEGYVKDLKKAKGA